MSELMWVASRDIEIGDRIERRYGSGFNERSVLLLVTARTWVPGKRKWYVRFTVPRELEYRITGHAYLSPLQQIQVYR